MTSPLSFRPMLSPSPLVSEGSSPESASCSPQLFANGFSPELRQFALDDHGAYDEEFCLFTEQNTTNLDEEYVLLPPPKRSPAPSYMADSPTPPQSSSLKRKISPVNLEKKENNRSSPLNRPATAIAQKISSIRICSSCKTKKTQKLWHKNPLDKTKFRCESCYQKTLKKTEKYCSSCAMTIRSVTWHRNPQDGGKMQCRSCRYIAKTQIEKYCSSCEITKSSVAWYKNPNDQTKLRCRSCYNKSLAQIRKDQRTLSLSDG